METPPPPTPEAELKGYVEQLTRRLGAVEQELTRLGAADTESEERMDRSHAGFRAEAERVREEVRQLDEALGEIAKRTARLVAEFKTAVRAPQLERLRQRVDAWKGEQYITREELKKLVKQN